MSDMPLEKSAMFGERVEPSPNPSLTGRGISQAAAAWEVVERWLAAASDWLNPILVKETRQALRSWQFALVFVLLLVACWVVTIGGVALIGPSVYYAAGGGELLRAYYFILAFPLLVVVPFAAFRSLAAEREDNTYDLVSITALRPRQVISGKLGSAVVQMAVYLSAITPCLAFTYLLRGVDVPTIVLLLAYTFFASLALSMLGLLLATLSRQRHNQVVLSVVFVAVLLGTFYLSQLLAEDLVRIGFAQYAADGNGYYEFLVVQLTFGILYTTFFALAYLAAAGLITFASDNRSTPLRIAMLVQQAALVGWVAYAWTDSRRLETILYPVMFAGFYWWAMGTMLTGERSAMSNRVRRHLPQSTLGRAFFTWFNPGPSCGYMFMVANLTSLALLCTLPLANSATMGAAFSWLRFDATFQFIVLGWSYVVAYLGLGCLAIALLRRVAVVTMFAGVLIHVLLVLAGGGIPTSIQLMSLSMRNDSFSYLQVTNPVWTLSYVLNYSPVPEAPVLLVVVPAAAVCVLVLNMPGVVRELRRVRTALPPRVAEDEAILNPPPDAGPKNPWEEPGAVSQEP